MWSLLSCKKAHYSKSIKGINTTLGTLVHHHRMQGHNFESYSFRVMLLVTFLTRMMAPDRRELVPHAVIFFKRVWTTAKWAKNQIEWQNVITLCAVKVIGSIMKSLYYQKRLFKSYLVLYQYNERIERGYIFVFWDNLYENNISLYSYLKHRLSIYLVKVFHPIVTMLLLTGLFSYHSWY